MRSFVGRNMSSPQAPVRIFCLGHFRIERDGGALDAETSARTQRKPLALLKTLIALGGQNIPEQQLTDAVWPDADGDSAHSAFASALHRLRQALGADGLPLRQGRLSLSSQVLSCDFTELESLLARCERKVQTGDASGVRAAIEQALALYRGPFLEGDFDPPDILPVRERLHARLLRCTAAAGELVEKSGEGAAAVAIYQKGIEADPLAEELVQGLMRILHNLGRGSEGILAYQRFREALKAAANAEPSAETEALAAELRSAAKVANAPTNGETESRAPGPESSSRASASQERPFRLPRRRVRIFAVAAALLVGVGLAAFFGARWMLSVRDSRHASTSASIDELPSIAVLPFTNMSGDPEQEYFSDGLTDSLITDLSKLRNLIVIARQSVFTYKATPVDVRQVGRDLHVRYVLEGSVQRTADRVRINAQLVEAESGRHLWAERWDRPLSDLFDVQDEIVSRIVSELGVIIAGSERLRLLNRSTRSLAAFENYSRGFVHMRRTTRVDERIARRFFEEALEADPSFALAKVLVGWTHEHEAENQWSESPGESYEMALRIANDVIATDPDLGIAYFLASTVISDHKGDFDLSLRMNRRAVELTPNDPSSVANLGWMLSADPATAREGLALVRKGMRLDPLQAYWMYAGLSANYRMLGEYREAVDAARICVEHIPDFLPGRLQLVLALMEMGDREGARKEAQEIKRRAPNYAGDFLIKLHLDPAIRERSWGYLAELGLMKKN
jgi:TolB-like protein/DNA-binding SARP family transcriptional activator/Tfp pilus assembly protein PilF